MKGFAKKNFLSKQDETDKDEYVVIKKKSSKGSNDESDEENDGSKEVLFMAFTEDDE